VWRALQPWMATQIHRSRHWVVAPCAHVRGEETTAGRKRGRERGRRRRRGKRGSTLTSHLFCVLLLFVCCFLLLSPSASPCGTPPLFPLASSPSSLDDHGNARMDIEIECSDGGVSLIASNASIDHRFRAPDFSSVLSPHRHPRLVRLPAACRLLVGW
jgi:hypothetical protein